jgi:UDP-N-acetylglucosamine 2-epimerase (non-hydrolysing)/GDP/UDP-N,N'-diacetylbacillosamine 2-epimerase (hydrolysing)
MKKICIITGSRAEYGLLSRLMHLIKSDSDLLLQIIATNMHLSPAHGLTYREIENDGFQIDKKVAMLLSSDTPNATAKSVGLGTIGFADAYEDLKPELLLVLGDRFEILAAVSAALFYNIPVGHIHGGELTEGAYDDAIRHAVTKMCHLHFTSTEEYRSRVIQMGEEPGKVFNVGALGIDNIRHTQLLKKVDLEKNLNFRIGNNCLLVTYHPVTLQRGEAEIQIKNLLTVLEKRDDLRIIFTYPNSDTGAYIIKKSIDMFVAENNDRSVAFSSMGHLNYLSALQYVNAVVGNSSSGIIEVPSFGIPTLNIGDRQKGRIMPESVVNCDPEEGEIDDKIEYILSPAFRNFCRNVKNLYEKENTAVQIHNIIKNADLIGLYKKRFYNL